MVLGLLKNNYYKYPEGTHPFQKVRYFTQSGLLAGVTFGLYDACLLSSPATVLQAANCMAYWVVPITSMCAVSASVKYLSTNLRQKDDEFNCIPAILSVVPILKVWLKRPYAFNLAVTGIAMISMVVYEHFRLNGVHLLVREMPAPKEYGIDCEW